MNGGPVHVSTAYTVSPCAPGEMWPISERPTTKMLVAINSARR
jgi:hypothetical protein